MTRHLVASINNRGTTVCQEHEGRWRTRTNEDEQENTQTGRTPEHLGARQETTERCGQAPTWCTLLKLGACMRRKRQRTRALVNVTVTQEMVGDIVGLLFSLHCCSYLLNTLETQTQWRRNKRKRLMLRNQVSKTAATGLSSNNVIFTHHVKHPPSQQPLGNGCGEWRCTAGVGCCSSGAGASDWKDPVFKHGYVVRPKSEQKKRLRTAKHTTLSKSADSATCMGSCHSTHNFPGQGGSLAWKK